MPEPAVLAVLVAHASSSWLDDTCRALADLDADALSVVVARVGDVRIPDTLPDARLRATVDLPAGTGYAEAVRRAVDATGGDEPYLLLVHDDAAPEPAALRVMLERAADDPSIAAVGAKLLEWGDAEVLQEVGGFVDRFARRRTGLEADEVDHGQHDQTDDVLYCSSAFLLVRRDAWDEVGGIDVDAWPLYDDVDLCWRLRASGRRVVVCPAARVRHAAALSRGMRRGAGRAFGALGIRSFSERGRLRFMLKNYGPLSLAAMLPQYAVLAVLQVLSGLVRREFWRARTIVGAVVHVSAELPQVVDLRRRRPKAVEDQELLGIGARRALAERRYERTEWAGRAFEAWRRVEERGARVARDPVVWGGAIAALAYVIVLRGVLFGGGFTLGDLRRPLSLGDALLAYVSRPHPHTLDPYGPGTPGVPLFGLLRWIALGSAALAEKLALLLPLPLAAAGAVRLGRHLGLEGRGRRWLAVVAMVNPVTLLLARQGSVGALVAWGATWWIAVLVLTPPGGTEEPRDRLRRRARWALAWIAVVAVHPPSLVWFVALSVALSVARRGDGLGRRRAWLTGVGAIGALVGLMPWSLQWFTSRTPLVGRGAGFLPDGGSGLQPLSFHAGWPLVAWTVVAIALVFASGPTRTTTALTSLLAVSWLAGAAGVFPAPAALVASGWCVLALLALAVRRVSDELTRYALGWRHGLVIGAVAVVAIGWGGAALGAIAAGTRAHTVSVVATSDGEVGRVLWLDRGAGGTQTWVTDGFRSTLASFPGVEGPEEEFVLATLDAVRERRTHRAGALLALADVSHVVALRPDARRGLTGQADLAAAEAQGGAVVYRNEAWLGPAMLLSEPPADVLEPEGLAGLVGERAAVDVTPRLADATVTLPADASGVLYLAGGARGGWGVGDQDATPAAAGTWVRASRVADGAPVDAGGELFRWLYLLQGAVLAALVATWLAAVYLTGPEASPSRPSDVLALQPSGLPKPLVGAPIVVLAIASWVGWAAPLGAGPGPFLSEAWYCPPAGQEATQRLGIANPSARPVSYLVRPNLFDPPTGSGEIAGRGRATLDMDASSGAVIESYGRPVAVGVVASRERSATAVCATSPQDVYPFPEGGRGALRAAPRLFESYILYNPFPELARASVRFVRVETDEEGEPFTEAIAPPALQDVQVQPGASVVVDPEGQFFFPVELSTSVDVWQGRAIVARRLRTVEDLSFSIGAQPVASGIVPIARTAGAVTELIGFNPTDEPVRVSLGFVGARGSVPDLSFTVEPRGRISRDLNDAAPDEESLLVTVTASDAIPLEVLVVPEDRSGISLLPLLQPASRWVAPIAERRTLYVTNPQTTPVRLTFERLGPGPRIAPRTVGASRTLALPLEGTDAFGLVVRAAGGDVTVALAGQQGGVPAVPF